MKSRIGFDYYRKDKSDRFLISPIIKTTLYSIKRTGTIEARSKILCYIKTCIWEDTMKTISKIIMNKSIPEQGSAYP